MHFYTGPDQQAIDIKTAIGLVARVRHTVAETPLRVNLIDLTAEEFRVLRATGSLRFDDRADGRRHRPVPRASTLLQRAHQDAFWSLEGIPVQVLLPLAEGPNDPDDEAAIRRLSPKEDPVGQAYVRAMGNRLSGSAQ